jgi:hypothetical protein
MCVCVWGGGTDLLLCHVGLDERDPLVGATLLDGQLEGLVADVFQIFSMSFGGVLLSTTCQF